MLKICVQGTLLYIKTSTIHEFLDLINAKKILSISNNPSFIARYLSKNYIHPNVYSSKKHSFVDKNKSFVYSTCLKTVLCIAWYYKTPYLCEVICSIIHH